MRRRCGKFKRKGGPPRFENLSPEAAEGGQLFNLISGSLTGVEWGNLNAPGIAILMHVLVVFIGRQIDRQVDRLSANWAPYF
jgi:hypothetical protein